MSYNAISPVSPPPLYQTTCRLQTFPLCFHYPGTPPNLAENPTALVLWIFTAPTLVQTLFHSVILQCIRTLSIPQWSQEQGLKEIIHTILSVPHYNLSILIHNLVTTCLQVPFLNFIHWTQKLLTQTQGPYLFHGHLYKKFFALLQPTGNIFSS